MTSTSGTVLLGFVGGIGSRGSAAFAKKMVDASLSTPFILFNNPEIGVLSGNKQLICSGLEKTFEKLAAASVTHAAILCNTAHLYLQDFTIPQSIQLIDLIEEAAKHIIHKFSAKARIGVIGTKGLFINKLYQVYFDKAAKEAGSEEPANLIPPTDLELTHNAIMSVIGGKDEIEVPGKGLMACVDVFTNEIAALKQQHNVDVVVLACTDIGINFHAKEVAGVPVVDPLDVLVAAALELSN